MKTTLLIMAAGLGSRYGGNKQIDHIGPHGEILLEYSIYDAVAAGFDKVVFVIKRSMADTFRELIGDKIAKKVEVEYAYQEYDSLPDGFVPPEGRTKPYGTVHAVLGLLAEDINKMLDAIPSLYNLPMTLIRDPAFARLFSDLYIAAQTGTISITSEELNRMAASVLGKIYSMEYLDGLNFSDIYHNLLASVVQSSEVARAYRSAMRGYLLSNFRLSGQIGIDKGELLFSQPYQEPYHLTYEQTTPNSWHYLLTTANSDTIDGVLYWRNEYDFALSGYSENQHTAFSVTCSYGSANNFVFIASVDNSFSLSIVQTGSNFSLRLDNENANVFALNANVFTLESTSDYIRVKIYYNYYTLTITPATDGLDIVAQARTFDIFTAHVRTALNGLICTGVCGDTTYRLALTETATGFSLLLSLPDGDFHLDFAALSDTSCSLTFTDAAGQQVSLTGSLCTPESPVIPDAIGTIELTQLLDDLF